MMKINIFDRQGDESSIGHLMRLEICSREIEPLHVFARSIESGSDKLFLNQASPTGNARVTLVDYFRLLQRLSLVARDETCHLSLRPLNLGTTDFVVDTHNQKRSDMDFAGCQNAGSAGALRIAQYQQECQDHGTARTGDGYFMGGCITARRSQPLAHAEIARQSCTCDWEAVGNFG